MQDLSVLIWPARLTSALLPAAPPPKQAHKSISAPPARTCAAAARSRYQRASEDVGWLIGRWQLVEWQEASPSTAVQEVQQGEPPGLHIIPYRGMAAPGHQCGPSDLPWHCSHSPTRMPTSQGHLLQRPRTPLPLKPADEPPNASLKATQQTALAAALLHAEHLQLAALSRTPLAGILAQHSHDGMGPPWYMDLYTGVAHTRDRPLAQGLPCNQ